MSPATLQESEQRALQWQEERAQINDESLLELLTSFFATYTNATAVWTANRFLRQAPLSRKAELLDDKGGSI